MSFIEFQNTFRGFPIISISDIEKSYPNFDNRRLVEWQHKGYLIKIKNGYYIFANHEKSESFLFLLANKIYKPAYVSLESALWYYGLIPEGVFAVTSITTNNTATYNNKLGRFIYRHLKPQLFFGYSLIQHNGYSISIADPEKALLDFLYLNKVNDNDSIRELRINYLQIHEAIDYSKLEKYLSLFKSKVLNTRVALFKKNHNA
jgi:predicted transcriptional regulator of viral defense system